MSASVESLKNYIAETLHEPLDLKSWPNEHVLPQLLRHEYEFFEGWLANTKLLFLFARGGATPAIVEKHQQMLRNYTSDSLVVVADRATSAWRSRMIERGIPFVVPQYQMYLPMVAIDMREWFRPAAKVRMRLTPSAQVVLLRALQSASVVGSTPTAISRELGYSAMTVGRAFDQLEESGLVRVTRDGRERFITVGEGRRDLWDKAQPMLSSPVKAREWITTPSTQPVLSQLMHAGLTALSAFSMIAGPGVPVVAATRHVYRELLQEESILPVESADGADARLEIWSYSPHLLSSGSNVDPLSLYLSLRDDSDERVQSALEESMRGLPWL